MSGGPGNDFYDFFGFGTDTVIELANQGIDQIRAFVDIDLSVAGLENIENVTLNGALDIDVIGNALANIVTGSEFEIASMVATATMR